LRFRAAWWDWNIACYRARPGLLRDAYLNRRIGFWSFDVRSLLNSGHVYLGIALALVVGSWHTRL